MGKAVKLNLWGKTLTALFVVVIGAAYLAVTIVQSPQEQEIQHVFLIVIDAVRPDVLRQANTPNLDALAAEGSYTWNAWTICPSVTDKAIPSIFTGATPEVHGSAGFAWQIDAETLIDVFELAGLPCGLAGGESMSYYGIRATYETGYTPYARADERFTTLAIEMFIENRPFFMYVYNPMPDRIGHLYGPPSKGYREAIENADVQVGRLVHTLEELGVYEHTLMVVTTDHGMTYFPGQTPVGEHKHCLETDMRIWSIWRGPGIKENYEMVDKVYIPATETYEATRVAHRIIDIAPTICALVGLPPPIHAEGEVIWQIFAEAEGGKVQVKLLTAGVIVGMFVVIALRVRRRS